MSAQFNRTPKDIIAFGEDNGLKWSHPLEMLILFALFTSKYQYKVPGLLHCSARDICDEFHLDQDEFLAVWKQSFERKIASADWRRGVVYFPAYVRLFPPKNPNVVKGWGKYLAKVPPCEHRRWILRDFREAFKELGRSNLLGAVDEIELDDEASAGDTIYYYDWESIGPKKLETADPVVPRQLDQQANRLSKQTDQQNHLFVEHDDQTIDLFPAVDFCSHGSSWPSDESESSEKFDFRDGESANCGEIEEIGIDLKQTDRQCGLFAKQNRTRSLDQLDHKITRSLDHQTEKPIAGASVSGGGGDSRSKSNSKPKPKRTRSPEVQLEYPEASRRVAEQVSEIRKLVSRGSARGISTPLKSELGHIDERLVELTSELGSIDAAETRLVDVYKARAWKLGIAPTFKSGSSYEAWRASYKFLNIHSPLTGPGKGPGGWAMSLDVMREWEEHGCPEPAEVQITDEEKKQQEYEHFEKHILPEQIKIQRANQEQKLAEVRERLNAKPKEEAYVPF